MNDLGPISGFLMTIPARLIQAAWRPSCGAWHIFIFTLGRNGDFYAVEPFPEDSARGPR